MERHDDIDNPFDDLQNDDLLLLLLLMADDLGAMGALNGEYGEAAAQLIGARLDASQHPPRWSFHIQ